MSAENRVSLWSVAIGTLIPTVFGAMVGSAIAVWLPDWPERVAWFEGAICGGAMALVIGFVMSWHGGAIGGSPARCATAAIWGIIPGGLVGLSLGPMLGAAAGLPFGQLVGGGWIGLLAGWIVGIAAWELAFSSDEIIEALRRRRAARAAQHSAPH